VEYISEQLNALGGYYDVQLQPWEGLSQQYGEISFTVNGAVYDAKVVEFSSNVTATDVPLVVVPNLGCDAVSKSIFSFSAPGTEPAYAQGLN
jgi:carboxypeptidase Q